MNKQMGRPRLEFARNKTLTVRYTEEELKLIEKKAKEKDISMSQYVRLKSLTK